MPMTRLTAINGWSQSQSFKILLAFEIPDVLVWVVWKMSANVLVLNSFMALLMESNSKMCLSAMWTPKSQPDARTTIFENVPSWF
jgi:hypothetical protein